MEWVQPTRSPGPTERQQPGIILGPLLQHPLGDPLEFARAGVGGGATALGVLSALSDLTDFFQSDAITSGGFGFEFTMFFHGAHALRTDHRRSLAPSAFMEEGSLKLQQVFHFLRLPTMTKDLVAEAAFEFFPGEGRLA